MMAISNTLLNFNEFLVLHSNSWVNRAGFKINKIFKEV